MLYASYEFSCRFTSPAILPLYKGSTFRGVFGRALKSVVCALKQQTCEQCLLNVRCLYAQVFEPRKESAAIPADRQRIASPPHPYVIEPPQDARTDYAIGDEFMFNLLLFGEANANLPYFIYAIEQMGALGIGRKIHGKGGEYALSTVKAGEKTIYTGNERRLEQGAFIVDIASETFLADPGNKGGHIPRLGLRLHTPLRLKYQNQLNKPELPFHIIIRAALRRISSLFEAYGGGEPKLDYRGMVRRAEQVRVASSDIHWHDWRRYSKRQEQAMLMGGLSGEAIYEGDLAEFMPLLRFCELAHLGKQTTFGLGRIEVFEP